MYLKKLNLADAKKEYDFFQGVESENGFVNEYKNLSFDEFVSMALPLRLDAEKGINLKKGYVPDIYYFLYDTDDMIIGFYILRLYLNDFLRNGPGHIGYLINRNYRNKGYGKIGLGLLIDIIKKENLIKEQELYFECNSDNNYSIKTILANKGYIHHIEKECTYLRIKL